jgi:uncharacterized membrane protein YgcG
VLTLQEIEAVRARQRRKGIMAGAPPAPAAAGTTQQLPQHTPGLEQQLRPGQQPSSPSPTPPAAGVLPVSTSPERRRQAGGGIIALAHLPSSHAVAAAAAAEASRGSSGSSLLGSTQQRTFSVGADYNLGGPHTLGDLAAGISWAPALISASPAALAASHIKRQSAAPALHARHVVAGGQPEELTLGGSGGSGSSGRFGRTGSGGGFWGGLGRCVGD